MCEFNWNQIFFKVKTIQEKIIFRCASVIKCDFELDTETLKLVTDNVISLQLFTIVIIKMSSRKSNRGGLFYNKIPKDPFTNTFII